MHRCVEPAETINSNYQDETKGGANHHLPGFLGDLVIWTYNI
jgi:hypothetical protein